VEAGRRGKQAEVAGNMAQVIPAAGVSAGNIGAQAQQATGNISNICYMQVQALALRQYNISI
jgi:hypothetical protein